MRLTTLFGTAKRTEAESTDTGADALGHNEHSAASIRRKRRIARLVAVPAALLFFGSVPAALAGEDLVAAVCIAVGTLLYTASVDLRLEALESEVIEQ